MSSCAEVTRSADPIDLSDPDTYLPGPPHEYFTELRATDPVHWQPMWNGDAGYWAVLTHAGVEAVARQPVVFSSATGGVVLEDLAPPQLEQMQGMLLAMDPPRHREVRKPLTQRMTPRALGSVTDSVMAICREVFADAAMKGDVDFVHDVAAHLPTRVIGKLMGLPRADWEAVHRLAERVTHGQDPEYASSDADAGSASAEMGMYAYQFATDRLAAEPRDDLTDVLLADNDAVEYAKLFVQLVTAGQDTTQTMLSSGLLALLDHPGQLAALRDDLSLVPSAIEEILRWANPLHYFRRTATEDSEIEGRTIRAGEKVAMYYTSANRDEKVFDDPQAFDIRRSPNKHLSFGQAEHFCLGVHLARLEGRIFFTQLLSTFPTVELTGEPRRVRSNLNNALREFPVRLAS
jgi:cytochrome P450